MVLTGSESGGVFASQSQSNIMSGLEVEHGSEDRGQDLVNGETSPTPPSSSGSPSHKLDNINLMLADSFSDKTKLEDAAAAIIIPNGNAEVASSRQQDQQQQQAKQSAASTDEVLLAPAERMWTTERDGAVKLRTDASGTLSDTPETINQLFERTVKLYGDRKALASKEGNTWKILTYKEYYAQCRQAAKSFLKLGLQRYHGVGILGFNSPEWFISDIGAIMAGGFAVGIYTTNTAEACQYVADNCLANVIVVENDKQLQKILEVQSQLPHLKAIVQYKGELKEKKPNVYSWAEFMRAGEEVPDAQLDAIIASQRANQCCSLIYTSGTTGSPKGVMLSHDNLTWTSTVTGELTQLRSAEDFQEVVISYLPLSHIAAQLVDIWLPMRFGGVTYFAQPDALKGSLVVTMKEVRPTGFMGVPRVWEKMMEKMKATAAKSGIFKRKIAGWAKSVGLQTHLANMKGNPAEAPMGYTLASMLVFKKVREALGLDRCTKCYTGAAPITRDTLEFFLSLDIPVFELYGMSESSGPHTISSPTAFQIGSCGTLLRGCRTLLHSKDEEGSGEVCFWGRHVFMGYLNMEEKTREAIDDDGWLHSGDLGRVDEQGLLYITGRIKELIITAGGENVPPIPIEDAIKEELPVVSNAMVIGDRRKFLSVLLTLKCESNGDSGEPDDALTDEVVHWCQRVGSTATRASQIAGGKDPVVERAIRDGIERVNKRAPSNAQRVQKWELLLRDFSIPGGELGPTMKLKRPVVTKMYQELIERLYEDAVSPTTPDAPLPAQ
ncbi:long-chain-fatty-acid--CoA ligase ACSBG2 isoform X2 [Lethenteron reissneri]|uniref:long-chain-fatty-acid--CoA ligase ACSBG2 isoform X2 n=1 Tax=Lethenteron reissneri TaxID=7753 RepID=UPI002AB62CD9|nr:long-chain-fatty-acid--CoA ligase ACSBG2 isoform X2 [Lethenteron reissneri]